MNKQKEQPVWNPRDICGAFALDLQQWSHSGKVPPQADQDLAWVLENQHARLRSRELELEYDMVPRGHFAGGRGNLRQWQDGHYITRMDFRSCVFHRTMRRRGRKVYNRKKNTLMYQFVTDVYDIYAARQDSHICPNCGASSTLAGLMDGCDYCGTRFQMSELYPKVGNYYHLEDFGMTQDEVKGDIGKSILKTFLWSALFFVVLFLLGGGEEMHPLEAVISGLLLGAFIGPLGGYLLWAGRKLVSLFVQAGRSIPLLIKLGNSEKRFENQMKVYSPEFSYPYFMDKAVNLLKTVLFSEDPRTLPFYQGEADDDFKKIVDSQFTGATSLRKFRVENGICHVTVDVCLDNLYDSALGIRQKRDWFRMEMYRDISKPVDLHFSIHSIQCGGCAASFDAVRHRTCPHCGRPYQLQDLDWMVQNIRKK